MVDCQDSLPVSSCEDLPPRNTQQPRLLPALPTCCLGTLLDACFSQFRLVGEELGTFLFGLLAVFA